MKYEDLIFKKPIESPTYQEDSAYVIRRITSILDDRKRADDVKIIINTNLKLGLPLENINKIAGPIVEAWAYEVFSGVRDDSNNEYRLINVEAQARLNMSDIVLQFKKDDSVLTGNVDVKSTDCGQKASITSFVKLRSAYVHCPNFILIVLAIKHKVYTERNSTTGCVDAIIEIAGYNVYDFKFVSDADVSFNPYGIGQIQINDTGYLDNQYRTTWDLCQLLDQKYLHSSLTFDDFYREATKYGWIE